MVENTKKNILNERKNTVYNANVSIDKFNWKAFEGIQKEDHIKDLYKEVGITTINKYEILRGVVTKILEKEIIVDIQFKYEGIIYLNEFRNNKDLKVGDLIDVMVDKIYKGQLILSHRKAKILRAWLRAKEAYKNREIITGKVTGRTKGGMIVRILDHIEAFMPGSQIDPKPLYNFDNFYSEVYNKSMEFKILKINNEYKNIVVSHKALIEAEIEKQKKKFISELQPGQVIIAKVKNITSYGAFCDMGGVDGLVHHSDISWKRINHPSEVLKINEKVKVVVLDFNEDKNRIQLGIKQILPHPWNSLDKNIKIGNKIKGKVIAVTEYGAFVEIESLPGVEALLHVSEISWSNQLKLAKDFVKIDDVVEAVILTLDRREKKMSLGIKQLTKNPWIDIKEKYKEGSRHKGKIRHFTNYGIFVELQEGIDGMIHNSDLSWSKKIKHPSDIFKLGDVIETVVLEMDVEHQRIHLGYKQLMEKPWEIYEKKYILGTIHKGKIINILDKIATVKFEDEEIEAFAPLRFLEKEDRTIAKKGEILPLKVIEFNKDMKRIVVSHSLYNEVDNKSKTINILGNIDEKLANIKNGSKGLNV